ncbi:MAG: UDP-N-acetylmuramoyl-L-alanyl-D-glutamate--2,6-diaminopimelate ligase [Candidatus Saccharibacteria bacterium]|nr:UDP-N-acetylmuramoyl-L-alanyl-D-glutamate--2,6-diaminopimelate ligase [Candidatus Saccharibacteria bacterium]
MKKVAQKIAKKTFGNIYDKAVIPKHYGVALTANLKRKFPARNLKVIGVTGTNGKTTTCFMIHSILCQAGYNVGLMTTVAHGLNNDLKSQTSHMTTDSVEVILNRIKTMKQQGLDWLVLEVTSQALAQFRILGIPISIAVMTNITHDHLDYHKTFTNYLKAKLKLFKMANRNKAGYRLGIINSDDEQAIHFAEAIKNVVGYSQITDNDQTIARPSNLKLMATGSRFTIKIQNDNYDIVCNLPGSFNVENAMAAILSARAIGVNKKNIELGLANLKEVEGRMISLDEQQLFSVIIDFAHTPDSFLKIFRDLRPLVKGKLIAVFGSAGRRDKVKRQPMGTIAGKYADLIIITEDDPRDEGYQVIADDILKGVESQGKHLNETVFLIENRRQAIRKAINLATSKLDMVLLLGKGHEKSLARAGGDDPWDEITETRKLLRQYLKQSDHNSKTK